LDILDIILLIYEYSWKMALDITLTGNYDSHTITLCGIDLCYARFKGTITGSIHNYDIDFVYRYGNINEYVYYGYIYKYTIDAQVIIKIAIPYCELFDPSEVVVKIEMGNIECMSMDDMDTCVFSEVMPMKGVHDG